MQVSVQAFVLTSVHAGQRPHEVSAGVCKGTIKPLHGRHGFRTMASHTPTCHLALPRCGIPCCSQASLEALSMRDLGRAMQAVTDAWALGAAMPALDDFTHVRARCHHYTPYIFRRSRKRMLSHASLVTCVTVTFNEGVQDQLGARAAMPALDDFTHFRARCHQPARKTCRSHSSRK